MYTYAWIVEVMIAIFPVLLNDLQPDIMNELENYFSSSFVLFEWHQTKLMMWEQLDENDLLSVLIP